MTLRRSDFAAFFRAVHGDDRAPFAWQARLLDHVISARSWPATIDAPTGSGKTAVIDVHVFALALAVATGAPLPPRRLSMVVGRRVLVDDQHRHTVHLREALVAPEGGTVLAEVAGLLWRLRDLGGQRDRALMSGNSPLVTARLRGGEPPTRMWTDEPNAAAVLCATPDMWGSRVLFRGYGSSWRSWPRAAGLLAFDSVLVVDEAHLSRQFLTTARRVGELTLVTDGKELGVAPLQVVATTATPQGSSGERVGVDPVDLEADAPLALRLGRPKPVTLLGCADSLKTTPRNRGPADIARAVVDLRSTVSGYPDVAGTVGCFVNTVGRAVAVAHELRSATVDGRRLRVVMVCGQVRPHDVARLRARYPGLLDTAGNFEVDAIVATQTLEVGADLDLAGMVTELAGGSALVQRAGRVNRLGRRGSGPVTVVVPTVAIKDGQRSGPYGHDELADSWAWLEKRAVDPGGLAPWALRGHAPPPAPPRRTLYQRPELAEAAHWARTSDALAAEPELDLWLAEDLASLSDLSLGLVVREAMPVDDAEGCALIGALRPRRHETFPVPFLVARDALARAHGESVEESGALGLRALIYRGGDVGVLTWTRRDDGGWRPDNLRPGDVVVVDASVALFTAASDESPQVLVPAGDDSTRHAAPDVLEELPPDADGGPVEPRPGQVVHRIELDLSESDHESEEQRERRRLRARLRDDLTALRRGDPADDAGDVRSVVAAWLDQHGETAMAGAAAGLLLSPERAVDVEPQGDEEAPARVVVVDRRRAVADEDIRQEWTSSTGDDHQSAPPTLDAHQRDVGERAAAIGVHAGLSDELVDVLRDAGLHHDDGKIDTRFQARLGNSTAQPRAKGYAASPLAAKRREERAGLPPGWRHEQRSVCDAWPSLTDGADRDLVARLVGTSHGQGRSGFPHVAGELLDEPDDVARDLFDHGGWDVLVERTHRRYGVWGCAYLESLLRAADGQISAEGR